MAECPQCEKYKEQLRKLTYMYKDKNKQIERLEHSKQAAIDNLKRKIKELVCKRKQDDDKTDQG